MINIEGTEKPIDFRVMFDLLQTAAMEKALLSKNQLDEMVAKYSNPELIKELIANFSERTGEIMAAMSEIMGKVGPAGQEALFYLAEFLLKIHNVITHPSILLDALKEIELPRMSFKLVTTIIVVLLILAGCIAPPSITATSQPYQTPVGIVSNTPIAPANTETPTKFPTPVPTKKPTNTPTKTPTEAPTEIPINPNWLDALRRSYGAENVQFPKAEGSPLFCAIDPYSAKSVSKMVGDKEILSEADCYYEDVNGQIQVIKVANYHYVAAEDALYSLGSSAPTKGKGRPSEAYVASGLSTLFQIISPQQKALVFMIQIPDLSPDFLATGNPASLDKVVIPKSSAIALAE